MRGSTFLAFAIALLAPLQHRSFIRSIQGVIAPLIEVLFGPISTFALPFVPNGNNLVCDGAYQNCSP
jgi:hypothetical protein